MSNFYFCEDCKKPTDLRPNYGVNGTSSVAHVCKWCGSTNWKAVIDND